MVSVIIPTFNGGSKAELVFKAVTSSALAGELIVIDSGSTDGTLDAAKKCGARIMSENKKLFDHGETRNKAAKTAKSGIVVFLTQDSLPEDGDAIKKLVLPLMKKKDVVISYGRQLPAEGATIFASHLRTFNYPDREMIKTLKDRETMGIKAAFVSNSFAAYKKSFLQKIGWFKAGLPMGEDVYAGAMALKAGYKTAYTPAARVFHSHNYSLLEEFARYCAIGCFYKKEKWILDEFGAAESEGTKFVKSEIKLLAGTDKWHLIPFSLLRAGVKLAGYKTGRLRAAIGL